MRHLVLLGLVCTLGAGCANSPQAADSDRPDPAVAQMGQERLLAHSASLGLRVEGVESAAEEAQRIVKQLGGFVASLEAGGEANVWIRARVPSEQLPEAMRQLGALGDESHRTLEVHDVTDEFVDLEARLANLLALRDRLRVLLDRATDVKEVLSIERELTRVQSELDSLEGRLKRLRQQIELASLEIQLSQRQPKRILGPLGYVVHGTGWVLEKLFVIRRGEP